MAAVVIVLRVLLLLYAVFALLFSALFDNGPTALLYLAATALAVYGLFEPRASLAALGLILVAMLTSWGGYRPGH